MSDITDSVQDTTNYKFRDEEEFVETKRDWIRQIPSNWSVIKLARCLESLDSGSRDNYDGNNGVFSIGGEHITEKGSLTTDNEKFVSERFYDSMNGGRVRTEDVLLVKDGATIGKCAIVDEIPYRKAAVNSHVYVLRGKEFCSNKFLYYLIDSEIVQEQIQVSITGSAQEGLSRKFTKFVNVPMPPRKEQEAIVDFLDIETSQISKLIENKSRLIELLEEKRAAIINELVTSGIDKSIKKEIDLDWCEGIPEGWETTSLRNTVNKFVDYRGATPVKSDTGITLITAKNIDDGELDFSEDHEYVTEEVYSDWMTRGYPEEGDVLITTEAPMGEVAQVKDTPVALAQRIILLKVKTNLIKKDFLKCFLDSEFNQTQLMKSQTGSTAKGIKASKLKGIRVLIPPLSEQEEILEEIEQETQKIDEIISVVNSGIKHLKEYRKALITKAVTGQIDVRGEV
jgi:type I restriction enzyme S subunit